MLKVKKFQSLRKKIRGAIDKKLHAWWIPPPLGKNRVKMKYRSVTRNTTFVSFILFGFILIYRNVPFAIRKSCKLNVLSLCKGNKCESSPLGNDLNLKLHSMES